MRSRTIQIIIALVVISFIIGWFAYFERTPIEEAVPTTVQLARGSAVGKVQSYRPELYISPWNESLNWLKNVSDIEEIKIIDRTAVLLLNRSATEVRALLKDEAVDAEALATIVITEPVDFLLANGTRRRLPISPFRARLDPITPVGEELAFEITAHISDTVEQFTASPMSVDEMKKVAITTNNTICTQNYSIEFSIPWEQRELNVLAIRNITEHFDWQRNDSITFASLDESESAAIVGANMTYIIELGKTYAIVNTTDRVKVAEEFSKLNISVEFPNSTLTIYGNESVLAATEIFGWEKRVKRLCYVHIVEIGENLVRRNARDIEVYLTEDEKSILLRVSRIGRLINNVEILRTE